MRTSIIYEDEQVIVAYKPAGLAVQTARVGQADMVSELKNYCAKCACAKKEAVPYLGLVHRLDQPVEGLLVFGRTKAASAELGRQLSRKVLKKRYYAVVYRDCGNQGNCEGELVDYLFKTPDNRAEIVEKGQGRGGASVQKAILQYQILESLPVNFTRGAGVDKNGEGVIALADIHIDTGRFHQIRAQMAHAGMPLLGDMKYGSKASKELGERLSVRSVALCAYELQFEHPVARRRMYFRIEPKGEIFRQFAKINQK